jgi:hypothetical protein
LGSTFWGTKGGKYKLRRMIKRRKFTTAILRQAQHDKAQETNGIAISIMMNAE